MQNELYHYGVKGMQWGVRRNLGKQSRNAARIKMAYDKTKKKIDRYESRSEKRQLSDRKLEKLNLLKNNARQLMSAYKSGVKELSKKDIEQGERAVKVQTIAKNGAKVLATGLSVASLFSDPVMSRYISKGANALAGKIGLGTVSNIYSKTVSGIGVSKNGIWEKVR